MQGYQRLGGTLPPREGLPQARKLQTARPGQHQKFVVFVADFFFSPADAVIALCRQREFGSAFIGAIRGFLRGLIAIFAQPEAK